MVKLFISVVVESMTIGVRIFIFLILAHFVVGKEALRCKFVAPFDVDSLFLFVNIE